MLILQMKAINRSLNTSNECKALSGSEGAGEREKRVRKKKKKKKN